MKSIFEYIKVIFFYVVIGICVLATPLGYYHSYKKHSTKDFIITIFLPPYAMYRGAEMFWHKDKKELSKDNAELATKLYAIICNQGLNGERSSDALSVIAEFKKSYRHLDDDGKKEIRKRAQDYSYYTYWVYKAMMADIQNKINGAHQYKSYNEEVVKYKEAHTSYGLIQEVNTIEKGQEIIFKQIQEKIPENNKISKDKKNQLIESMSMFFDLIKDSIGNTYKEIFSETLTLPS